MRFFFYSFLITLFLLPLSLPAWSLDENAPAASSDTTEVNPWNLGGWFTLNGTQASFRNWSQGGVNSITASSTARFTAEFTRERYVFNHTTNLKYGQSRINGNEFRKTDDEIRIRNQLRRVLDDPRFSLITQFNFSSQFDKGYDRNRENVISGFLAPAYITQTIGFAYNPGKSYQFDLGISMRQTIVRDTTLSTRYGLKSGEKFKNEGGISLGIKIDKDIMTNVNYLGQVETFSNLLEPLSSSTVRFTNEFIGKINNYLSANFQVAFLYDDNFSKELQVKQVLSIGFSYRFL